METYGIYGDDEVWVSLDPGVTTGWALIDEDLKILGCGVFAPSQVRDGVDELIRGCHRSKKVVRVVMEKLPRVAGHGDLAEVLDSVIRDIYENIVDTYDLQPVIVAPGEWKPSRHAAVARRHIKENMKGKWKGRTMTQHEKDAIMMGIYAVIKDRAS